jgi:hypothetical protein
METNEFIFPSGEYWRDTYRNTIIISHFLYLSYIRNILTKFILYQYTVKSSVMPPNADVSLGIILHTVLYSIFKFLVFFYISNSRKKTATSTPVHCTIPVNCKVIHARHRRMFVKPIQVQNQTKISNVFKNHWMLTDKRLSSASRRCTLFMRRRQNKLLLRQHAVPFFIGKVL